MVLVIFTDESLRNRFKSIGAVSIRSDDVEMITARFRKILLNNGLKEIKFSKAKTYKPKLDCAREFFQEAIDLASEGKIKVDVIIWDIRWVRNSKSSNISPSIKRGGRAIILALH